MRNFLITSSGVLIVKDLKDYGTVINQVTFGGLFFFCGGFALVLTFSFPCGISPFTSAKIKQTREVHSERERSVKYFTSQIKCEYFISNFFPVGKLVTRWRTQYLSTLQKKKRHLRCLQRYGKMQDSFREK
jgi:hypothetical protein